MHSTEGHKVVQMVNIKQEHANLCLFDKSQTQIQPLICVEHFILITTSQMCSVELMYLQLNQVTT